MIIIHVSSLSCFLLLFHCPVSFSLLIVMLPFHFFIVLFFFYISLNCSCFFPFMFYFLCFLVLFMSCFLSFFVTPDLFFLSNFPVICPLMLLCSFSWFIPYLLCPDLFPCPVLCSDLFPCPVPLSFVLICFYVLSPCPMS